MNAQPGEKKPKENIFYIRGMHCSSCEILIEKKLLKQPQILAADVSLGKRSARVSVERGKFIDTNELNRIFAEDGYKFSKQPFADDRPPLFSYTDGKLVINKQKFNSLMKILLVFTSFLFVFFSLERMQLGRFITVDTSSSLVAFFLLGLIAGLSSCAALIGGILLSLTKHWNELAIASDGKQKRKTPHLLFHVGRIASFFLLGGLLGMLGDTISLNNTVVYGSLVTIISLVMFLLALQMLGVSWAQRMKFSAPKFITRFAADETSFSGKQMPFLTGALTFFLPCGFTLIAQGVALTTGSFFQGAAIMLFFALGTLPLLASISLTGLTFTKRPHLTANFTRVAGLLILFFALYNINGQLNVLGLPSLSDLNLSSSFKPAKPDPRLAANPGEQQEINIIAEGFDYTANGPTVLAAGVPTTLIVENRGVLGCAAYMASRGLIDSFVQLQTGVNKIDLGTPKPGTYKITCSMGMVAPVAVTFN